MNIIAKAKSLLSDWSRSPALRLALLVFIVLRLVITLWMWGVRQIFPQPIQPHPVLRPYLGVAMETNPWLEPWQRWDALHYQAIAERGYKAYDSALFVPPLYPCLMGALAPALGGNTLLAGMVVSNLAFIGCLMLIYQIAEKETRDPQIARRAVIYLAWFPTAIFLLATYTESLYLLAAMFSLHLATQERWLGAGFWGGIAALTRLPGLLIVLPLAYLAWISYRRTGNYFPWASVGLTMAGAAIFPMYVWLALRLPPWTPWFVHSARAKGGIAFLGANVFATVRRIITDNFLLTDVTDLILLSVFLVSTIFIWQRLSRVYFIYQATLLALLLMVMNGMQPLQSAARYVLVLFPSFIVFGIWGQNPWLNRAILYTSIFGLFLLSGQFAIWGWIG